jgi:IMP dehydrogenase
MHDRIAYQGITFDDVLLEPGYSEVVPKDVDVRTQLTRTVRLNIPLLSSPMDTVTESELAIALAQEGGLGVIHKNLKVADQAREVEKVKRSENGIIVDPLTLTPDATVAEARELMAEHHVSGVPITVGPEKQLRGILTRRDLKFLTDNRQAINEVMTKHNLVTAPENTTLEEAEAILTRNKVEKLLLVDDLYRLKGLITIKDIDKTQNFPHACKDGRGRLRVGAAVGVHDYERADALIRAGVDVLTVDSAHGHSRNVVETVRELKRRFAIDVIAGNVATAEGARALADAGADAVKVGIGPGSICTTRIVSGVGVPQMTAIANAVRGLKGRGVPVVADGGVRYSGDVTKALAGGANAVMIGGLFAGLAESPGQTILYRGRTFKAYRGMGSLGAMVAGTQAGAADRYGQTEGRGKPPATGKLVPEGVEGRVPYKGPLAPFVFQLVGGVRAGMGYVGAATLDELRTTARFIQVSGASVQEGHPHDIAITQEAPNYSVAGHARSDAD